MKIKAIQTGRMYENAYVVQNKKTGEALVIDPGADPEKILAIIKEQNAKVKAILLTHGHFDHIDALKEVKQATGATIYIHEKDASMLTDPEENLSVDNGQYVSEVPADAVLAGGERLKLAGLAVKVLHTPGHTRGSVCYLIENALFAGDTIFYRFVGNTSFKHSSENDLIHSIQVVIGGLPGNPMMYPGHGIQTSLAEERLQNPYLMQ